MSEWGNRRKKNIKNAIYFITVIFLAIIIIPKLKNEPTCFDGRQNGFEKGVDCGGHCALFCFFETKPIIVRWARAVPVQGNLYNALAYIENRNLEAYAREFIYEFKFYDEKNIFIAGKKGKSFIGLAGPAIIFEPLVDLKGHTPMRTTFQIMEQPNFFRINPKVKNIIPSIDSKNLTETSAGPKLSARVTNRSNFTIPDLELSALLYDENKNVISASRTYIENFGPGQSEVVFFTWPKAFATPIKDTEIMFRFNPEKI